MTSSAAQHQVGRGARPEPFLDAVTGFSGWRVRLEEGRAVATPAVGGGLVFAGGGYGSHRFYAFEAGTGREVWRIRTDDDGPTAACLSDGCVAFATESCTLYVVEALTGRVLWKRWLGDPIRAQPAVMGGAVFASYPVPGRSHRLAAFRLRDGRPLWATEITNEVVSAPVVVGGQIYLATYDGDVSCLDLDDGRLRWTRGLRATAAPWVSGGRVYVAHREDRGAEVFERVSALAGGSVTWSSAPRPADYLRSKRGTAAARTASYLDTTVGFGRAPASARLESSEDLVGELTVYGTWRYQGLRPCVHRGHVYSTVGNTLTASDCRSHESAWSWRRGSGRQGERALTPPAAVNGRIIAATADGSICAWDGDSGDLRWSVDVGASVSWQSAIHGGWVYAGLEDGSLVAFDTGDPLVDGWPMWGGGPGHNGAGEAA